MKLTFFLLEGKIVSITYLHILQSTYDDFILKELNQ